MKKLFISILALAAFAACQNDFNDVNLDAPQVGNTISNGSHKIYAEVGIGEEGTKATYGDDLQALWEENDQIAILQEHANYGTTFGVVNKLNIKSGWGTSYAAFNGEISVDATTPRFYHIAYPASAVSFSTSSTLNKTSNSEYAYREDGLEVGHYYATASFDYVYNSTLNLTVATSQSGKWEPYMYASTEEAVGSTAIGAKTLNTLTGAIAIRAYMPNADGTKTPLQLKAIAVSATQPIAGAFSGTATSVGSLGTITGAETSDVYSTVSEDDVLWWKGAKYGREEAEKLLLAKAQSMEPASTTSTKAMSLSFTGSEYIVGANDVTSIAADNDGSYTYYLNVAPFENADLTIMATAVDGSTLIRNVSAQSLAASHRKGFVFTWESATLSCGNVETWYDDYNKSNFELQGNTLYVNNLEVKGVSAENVLTLGVVLNNELHAASAKSGVLTIDKVEIPNLTSGQYTAYAYAKVLVNGQEKELIGSLVSKNVTSIPEITGYEVRTSYSYNGTQSKTNGIDGSLLKVKADISDSYIANNLVSGKKYTIYYGSNTATQTLGSEWSTTMAYNAWGQYNCYVKIALSNGYVLESAHYTTHVTGIPYSYAFYKDGSTNIDAAKSAGWSFTGTGTQSDQVWICKSNSVGTIGSPKFHAPTNVDTKNTLSHRFYYIGSGSINAYVGASSSPSSAVKTATFNVGKTLDTGETGGLSTHIGNDANVVLTSSTPYITITSDSKSRISTAYHYVHAIKIEYR